MEHRAATTEKFGCPCRNSVPIIIRYIKSAVTRRVNILCDTPDNSIWQRNYYEHIIRNGIELNKIRLYIINNPPNWEYDRENQNGIAVDEKEKFWKKFFNE